MHSFDCSPLEFGEPHHYVSASSVQVCSIKSNVNDVSNGDTGSELAKCPGPLHKLSIPPKCLAGIRIYKQAEDEYSRIKQAYRTLAPTGCTPDFCQSGRATCLNEPRVGRDRPISEIEQEAVAFLQDCRDQAIISTDSELIQRIESATQEIRETSLMRIVTDENGNQFEGVAGGVWEQSSKELEYGIRASWKNSRRCIMRSKYEQLALCDLRHVTSSQQMAEAIIDGMLKAFNSGRILATVFVYPPRHPGKRGPMLWNHQILAFAGYRLEDGSIMGDPLNVSLTESIMELGWVSPTPRSQWDILPIVTMADGEPPYVKELPAELKRTIQIVHPRYKAEFKDLDLRWVVAPALSRLGFDIGGNQYTASPFIGYFMDAEIGVRNLADTSRFNVLPKIVETLQLSDDPETPFEDLPEFMRLAALSRAQTELNFAVYYSYMREHVTMVDSLTGSADYLKFDQEHKDGYGYRLPADPYWLSPPQGSIIPLWHQGAAPNYQPKPMICKHVQDPIKAWRREFPQHARIKQSLCPSIKEDVRSSKPKIRIFSCSAGINAGKMAKKLYEKLRDSSQTLSNKFDIGSAKCLNQLNLVECLQHDILLVIASTTGRGEIPRNAAKFMTKYQDITPLPSMPQFSVFGNGDSTYGDTFNAAGEAICELLKNIGCRPLSNHFFIGDTAISNPDWRSFNQWLTMLGRILMDEPDEGKLCTWSREKLEEKTAPMSMGTATLTKVRVRNPGGLLHVTLDIGDIEYNEMDHIKILTPNHETEVHTALRALDLEAQERLHWHHETAYDYLSRYVDLNHCFKTLSWYPRFEELEDEARQRLKRLKVVEVLACMQERIQPGLIEEVCKDISSLRPRIFSVASSPTVRNGRMRCDGNGNLVDIIVKVNPGGRFSETFLRQATLGTKMRFSLSSPDSWRFIRDQAFDAPFLAITTGSGIGPVRAILQQRLKSMIESKRNNGSVRDMQDVANSETSSILRFSRNSSCTSIDPEAISCTDIETGPDGLNLETIGRHGSVSLFAGFKTEDASLIEEIVRPSSDAGLFDVLELVPSNKGKVRVQDRLLVPGVKEKVSELLVHPSCIIFVCANAAAATATAANLSHIAGADVKEMLGERYIEEVFRC